MAIYESRRPLRSLARYLLFYEPSLRAFDVIFDIKMGRTASRPKLNYGTFSIFAEKALITFVTGVPVVYIKLCARILATFDDIKPNSLDGLKHCVQRLLAPHLGESYVRR